MSYWVLIPARMASTRFPGKPLADIAGRPMIVRVAQRAAQSSAERVVVAGDHPDIQAACEQHDIACVLTGSHHLSGSDRLAEACHLLGLEDSETVVNLQGDEPLVDAALLDDCAALLAQRPDCVMSTVAHPIDDMHELSSSNVVKVVCDASGRAMYFSRAPIPFWREGRAAGDALADPPPLRHIGLYGYRVAYLKRFPTLAASPLEALESLEQLRVLWHGDGIAVHVTQSRPGPGVDTPEDLERVRRLWR